jgi:hypothetical protein
VFTLAIGHGVGRDFVSRDAEDIGDKAGRDLRGDLLVS